MQKQRRLSWQFFVLILVALAFRLVLLDIKPPHFDEGVNGWFVDQITRTGTFKYDPTNYHGPLHFYVLFISQTLLGRNLWALRLPTVLVSFLSVILCWKIGNFLNRRTAFLAAWAMAVSPAMVFYGRYAIHESWLVFFLLLFVWAILEFSVSASRKSQAAFIASITGMILTKETYFIHLVCFLFAGGIAWLLPGAKETLPHAIQQGFRYRIPKQDRKFFLGSVGLGLFAIFFFYSGTFFNLSGVAGLWQTYAAWFQTGMHHAGGHAKAAYDLWKIPMLNTYWISLIARYEWPACVGLLCAVCFLFRSRWELRWLALYGVGCLYAYTLIPYKTPWCLISLLWPFFLLFGAIIDVLAKRWKPILWISVLLLTASAFQSIRLNFFDYANHEHPYVYVQTDPEIQIATAPLLGMAKQNPEYAHKRGQIFLSSYYPLPWILGDFTSVGYYGDEKKTPEAYDGDFIIIEQSQQPEIEKLLSDTYYRKPFKLRDGMEDCFIYFRASLYASWFSGQSPEFHPSSSPH